MAINVARPGAPPVCLAVFIIPDAAPASAGSTPERTPGLRLTELIPYDPDTEAHMRIRQSFTALALTDPAIAARLRDDYARFHQQIAQLLREENITAPDKAAMTLVATAEGLACYMLIGLYPADVARQRIVAAVADVCSS